MKQLDCEQRDTSPIFQSATVVLQIDFKNIRPLDGDRRKGFEELVCQLARRKPPIDGTEFRRVEGAGGDGGVEAYWADKRSGEHGVQAKFFLATREIDWSQVDHSVEAALTQHPQLVSYTVAFACDLTDRSGPQGKGQTGWEHWNKRKEKWEKLARAQGMNVQFSVWTKSTIIDDLTTLADRRGLALFWFNRDIFDQARIEQLFDRAVADLGERFHPEDNVRMNLGKAFAGLRRAPSFVVATSKVFSNLPSAASLELACSFLTTKPSEEILAALRDAAAKVRSIGAEIAGYGLKPYPHKLYVSAVTQYWHCISQMRLALEALSSEDPREKQLIKDAATQLDIMSEESDTFVPFVSERPDVIADRSKFLIIQGEPGSGKSHLFADVVSTALSERAPAVLLLGQNFLGDIRTSFLRGLGMSDQDFDTALQALDTAGEVAGQRTLILIDALNESGDLRMWPNELAGFVEDLQGYDHIGLAISLRPEYLNKLIPPPLQTGPNVISYEGIQTAEEQEQAAIQYFVKRGIIRPSVPWLAPEFSNFLFLRTVCDAVSLTETREFPRGLRGSLDVLRYYVDSIDAKLRREFPNAAIRANAVPNVFADVAKWMADRKRDSIDAASAHDICTARFGSEGPTTVLRWFNVLISEGAYRRDHILPQGAETDDPFATIEEVYRYSYQRFSDHLIVRALLFDVSDVKAAFAEGGTLAYLVDDNDWRWSSLWNAFAVQIPERFSETEIFDVVPKAPMGVRSFLSGAFEQSLLWRSPRAFSDKTIEFFNGKHGQAVRDQIDVLLRLATVKDHPWNADFLHKNLMRRPLAERDALWSTYVNQHAGDRYGGAPVEIINWCLNAPIATADGETLRLAALVLAWFFTTSARLTRDTATKALIRVLAVRPTLTDHLLDNFRDVDDLYVLERVCCAVYGATARSSDTRTVADAAAAIFRCIFDREQVPLELSLRDYATGTIDYAINLGCLPSGVDPKRCRAPFNSSWPLTIPTEDEVKKLAEAAGDESILFSAGGMGDFGSYEIVPAMRRFTNTPLNQERPLNLQEKKEKFETLVEEWPLQVKEAYAVFSRAFDARKASLKMTPEESEAIGFLLEYDDAADAEFITAKNDFFGAMNSGQRAAFDKYAAPTFFSDAIPYQEREIGCFDQEQAKRWVIANAYRRGWTAALFPYDSSNGNRSRGTRAGVERIGKKYQWLALGELLARLSDNVWSLKHYPEEAIIYDHPANDWFVRDVEPSFLVSHPEINVDKPWWLKHAAPIEPLSCPIAVWPFVDKAPTSPDWIEVEDPSGKPWLLLYAMYSAREERENHSGEALAYLRHTFVRVSSIIVESKEADAVWKHLASRRLADPSGHETIDWTDGPFLLEYPWRETWGLYDGFEREPSRPFEGVKYMRPVGRHVWESHLDASLPDGASLCVLNPWIARRLKIRPDLANLGSLMNSKGSPVCLDPAYGTAESSACLIDPNVFAEFLTSNGLECIWIIAGERNAYPSGKHGDYACRNFASIHRRQGKKWSSDEWLEDASSAR